MKTPESADSSFVMPTRSELEILQVLWSYGPSTVRFVNDKLNEQGRKVHYTSTLKLMQIMVEKKLLLRDTSQMKHIYAVAHEEKQARTQLLDRFVDTLFGGSRRNLVMALLGSEKTSREDLEKIREMINNMKDE
jgi:BlaI family penicillinase repressor